MKLELPMNPATNRLTGRSYSSAGPSLLLDPAVLHDDDDVAHRQRLLLVVGHVHERDPDLALELLELELHVVAERAVQGAQRLVQEQHAGMVDQGPGERDALLLATRQLPRPPPLVAGQPDELQRLAHPVASSCFLMPFWRSP